MCVTSHSDVHAQVNIYLNLPYHQLRLDWFYRALTLFLQVVAEMLETSMAGSESDLGLSPNGRIKLLKSSTIKLNSPIK